MPAQAKSTKPARSSPLTKVYNATQEPVPEREPQDASPASPPRRADPEKLTAGCSSPGATQVASAKSAVRAAKRREKESEKAVEAAAREEQLAELLLTALTKKVWRAMKAKGFRDSYWRPRLNKAEEKWWQSRLAKANAREVHSLRIGATYAAMLDEANVKMRSLRRHLRRRHVFGLTRW